MSEAENEGTPAEATSDETRVCGLAGASLLWGIASLLSPFAGFMAAVFAVRVGVRHTAVVVAVGLATALVCIVPAVACGHGALGRIKRAGGTLRGRGRAIAGTILGYTGLLLALFLAWWGVWALEQTNRAWCRMNLKALGQGCHNYASTHKGRLPESLSRLHELDGGGSRVVVRLPEHRRHPTAPRPD